MEETLDSIKYDNTVKIKNNNTVQINRRVSQRSEFMNVAVTRNISERASRVQACYFSVSHSTESFSRYIHRHAYVMRDGLLAVNLLKWKQT